MKILVQEGGHECEVVDRAGLRSRKFVKVSTGFWVGESGDFASISLSMRLEASVDRDTRRAEVRGRLLGTGSGL